MPSLAEATRTSRGRERRRLAIGVGLLLAGALLVGVGAAGVAGATTVTNGAVLGGLATLASLLVVATRAPLGRPERAVAIVGGAIGSAGLLLLWVVAPGTALATLSVVAWAAVFAYLLGLVVVLAAVLAAASLAPADRRRESGSHPVAWTRSDAARDTPARAADGGTTEDERSFLLDDE